MAINGLVRDPKAAQDFPRPSMPDATYEAISSCTIKDDEHKQREKELNEVHNHILGALREILDEMGTKGHELLKEIFSERGEEITLGKLVREAIGDSQAKEFMEKLGAKIGEKMKARKMKNQILVDRGVSIDDTNSTKELNTKVERFKVKTVNIGGVVVKDDQK